MSNTNERKAALEKQLSAVAGFPVEITIRGLREFTASAEGDKVKALEPVRAFLADGLKSWEASFDAETDFTCAFFTL